VAGVLIQMKLRLLRRSMTGSRGSWVTAGTVAGAVLAACTIALSLTHSGRPIVVGDLLALVYALWMLGWVAGPVWAGAPVLRAQHFALLPVPRLRLAVGLLGAAFAGLTTLVTLLAFTSLVVFAARLGLAAALVAVPAMILQLALVVLLSRVAVAGFGSASRSRTGAALIGLMIAGLLVLSQSGWMIFVAIQSWGVLTSGTPAALAIVVQALPSGWGLVAVESAGRSEWLPAAGALAGLAAAVGALLLIWTWTFGSGRAGRTTIRGARRAGPCNDALPRGSVGALPASPVGAVLAKELRTWWRDPLRTQTISLAMAWALGTVLLPLTFGSTVLLPWAGPAVALAGACCSANLYGQDGTALWLALVIPQAERPDVRGRQWAFVLVFGPIAIITAIGLTAASGLAWAWPWALALTPAVLGGSCGLLAVIWVAALVPGPDAHHRPDNPMDHGDATGPANLMFWTGLLPAVPPVGLLLAGTLLHNGTLRWAAVPVGIATGALLAWWLGRAGSRRLERRGPELLTLMRTGRSTSRPQTALTVKLPRWKSVTVGIAWTIGCILTFPQGIVTAGMKLGGSPVRSWFLALYLPAPLQWPACILMITLGALILSLVTRMLWQAKKAAP
jgi:hypothetical protein